MHINLGARSHVTGLNTLTALKLPLQQACRNYARDGPPKHCLNAYSVLVITHFFLPLDVAEFDSFSSILLSSA